MSSPNPTVRTVSRTTQITLFLSALRVPLSEKNQV